MSNVRRVFTLMDGNPCSAHDSTMHRGSSDVNFNGTGKTSRSLKYISVKSFNAYRFPSDTGSTLRSIFW